jgi:hypothetical protein
MGAELRGALFLALAHCVSLMGVARRSSSMRSMREFDPDRPARLHEVLND